MVSKSKDYVNPANRWDTVMLETAKHQVCASPLACRGCSGVLSAITSLRLLTIPRGRYNLQ